LFEKLFLCLRLFRIYRPDLREKQVYHILNNPQIEGAVRGIESLLPLNRLIIGCTFYLGVFVCMPKRVPVTKKTRFEVFKRDKFTCQYCGKSAPDVVLNIDHINPVKNKGDNNILNLITACFDCNPVKKARLLSDESTVKKQINQLWSLLLSSQKMGFLRINQNF